MQIAIGVIVSEIGKVNCQAAIRLAGAAVVTDQHMVNRLPHNGAQLRHQTLIHRLIQFTANAVKDKRRMMMDKLHVLLVFDRGARPQLRGHFR